MVPSIIKDKDDFLLKLKELGGAPRNAIVCTIDVVGLYPHILHCEGLEALEKAINDGVVKIPSEHLLNLAKVILDNNYFEFDERVYGQKLGIAIGTKFAPAFENIFMGVLKIRFWRLVGIDRGFGGDFWMIYL